MKQASIKLYLLLLILSFGAVFYAYFPGHYSNDSRTIFFQVLNFNFNDWHTPFMAFTWGILLKLTNLPESMFIIHTLILLIGGIFWVLITHKISSFLPIFVPLLILSPIITNFSAWIIRDVGFAYYMLLVHGIIILSIIQNKISRKVLATVFCLLFCSFATRTNGIFSLIPITFLSIICYYKTRPSIPSTKFLLKSSIGTIIVIATIVLGNHIFCYYILDVQKRYPFQYIKLFDLAGISYYSNCEHFPDYIKNLDYYNFQVMLDTYKSSVIKKRRGTHFFWTSTGEPPLLPRLFKPSLQKDLTSTWINAISKHPRAYLKHKWEIFNILMSKGIKKHYTGIPNKESRDKLFKNKVNFNEINFAPLNIIRKYMTKTNKMVQHSVLHLGWFWLMVSIAQFLMALLVIKNKDIKIIILLLSSSAILYIIPYFFIAPAGDFRYLYWSTIAISISSLFIMQWIKIRYLKI